MSGLCLAAGAITAVLNLQQFTLAWTHSIEKVRWEEDWRITDGRLEIVEARIRGTGAGMEPPEGARLANGVWHYRPALPPLESVTLAHSPYAMPYELCTDKHCQPLAGHLPGIAPTESIALTACAIRQSR